MIPLLAKHTPDRGRSSGPARAHRRVLAVTLSACLAVPFSALSYASATTADRPADQSAGQTVGRAHSAADFQGVNWARPKDNFVDGPVVPEGLSVSDDYGTVKAKASAVYEEFRETSGANTVRLPINTHSVPGTEWGDAYAGAVDAATENGFKVILSYWEDGASSNGRIVETEAFDAMWDAVVSRWRFDSRVHFEPMNEPHGYSAAEWADVAAGWIADRPGVPRKRILVSGHGYNGDVTAVCDDSRLAGTYLSLHLYAFQFDSMSYEEWRELFDSRIGDCGSRTVLDEFGAPMDDGRDYGEADSTDNFVRYIRAATDAVRSHDMGAVYWPALGGKHTYRPDYDWYSLYALEGSGTELSLRVRNDSMIDRLRYAWDGADHAAPAAGEHRSSVPAMPRDR
ncbi:Cellulase (glycosyl hydrolase family 5) [Actinopolyspora lacussalsi subsp. righensis]|uniref:Cellulase (Glycosyl hydrolase family 5) n=1 Tax=Actinopolyspora righensis TaxID=995060 RepID=A0A1I6XBR7_9ACTN|nr:cellulase family glycosylhydrolase [Actinopolyspora righensis]SFT35697.1 Cellulase (glycosyl hydrolase family 5) [Actinopolyspora righensis]